MRLLDLYCGAGGAAMGYHQAGFTEIIGVDIEPQPHYPFTFIQGDASSPPLELEAFDLIHASPPCQAFSSVTPDPDAHVDLVASTRALLQASGRHYVIENVIGAPLLDPIRLCATEFDRTITWGGRTFELRRHRIFEATFLILGTGCRHRHKTLGVYGHLSKNPRFNNKDRRGATGDIKAGAEQAAELMGIDWMDPAELVQAIPPAYTHHIGRCFL